MNGQGSSVLSYRQLNLPAHYSALCSMPMFNISEVLLPTPRVHVVDWQNFQKLMIQSGIFIHLYFIFTLTVGKHSRL